MSPNNANPTIVHLAPLLVPVPIEGKIEIRPNAAACAPQVSGMLFGFPIVETEFPAIGPIELASVRLVQ